MRRQRGFSLVELLVVLAMLTILFIIIFPTFLGQVEKARHTEFIAETRVVLFAAQSVLIEETAAGTDEEVILAGLSGTVKSALYPKQTEISAKISDILAPDVLLSDKPDVGCSTAEFTAKNGQITSLVYKKVSRDKLYTVIIKDGKTEVSSEPFKSEKKE